jgi:hypothetical protein
MALLTVCSPEGGRLLGYYLGGIFLLTAFQTKLVRVVLLSLKMNNLRGQYGYICVYSLLASAGGF